MDYKGETKLICLFETKVYLSAAHVATAVRKMIYWTLQGGHEMSISEAVVL